MTAIEILAIVTLMCLSLAGWSTVLVNQRNTRSQIAVRDAEIRRLKRSVAALTGPPPVTEPEQVKRETEQRFELAGRIVSPTYGPNAHKSYRARIVDNRQSTFEWVNERLGRSITDRERVVIEDQVTYRVEIDWRWAPDSIVSWQLDRHLTDEANGRRLTKEGGQPGWFDTRREAEQRAHEMLDKLDLIPAGKVVQ